MLPKKPIESSLNYFKEHIDISTGNIGMQIVTSGPDSINEQIKHGYIKNDFPQLRNQLLSKHLISYLMKSILEAIKIASASGVDVRIMIPNKT